MLRLCDRDSSESGLSLPTSLQQKRPSQTDTINSISNVICGFANGKVARFFWKSCHPMLVKSSPISIFYMHPKKTSEFKE